MDLPVQRIQYYYVVYIMYTTSYINRQIISKKYTSAISRQTTDLKSG